MNKTSTYFLFVLSTILLFSCSSNNIDNSTYFGGKIINPKSKNVILFYLEEAIDTLMLDNENKFLAKYDSLVEGLYHFKHGNEYQYIYLEPKDSLMLRLNTWDFDESLVYAGIGAERNNILIDCFIEDEKENKLFYQFNKLNSKNFKAKIDSIIKFKLTTFNKYVKKHPNETEGFKEILKIALTYPTYTKAERYPISHSYYSKSNVFPLLIEGFYDYRKDIIKANSTLMYYSPYSNYMLNYLYNKTYSLGYTPRVNDYSEKFTIDLLNIINSEIKSETAKNPLLKQTVISHFRKKTSNKINYKTFDRFFELSTNEDDKKQVEKFINDINAVPINKEITNFTVNDYNNASREIKDVIKNKNTFLLFWNPQFIAESYIVSRIKFLSNNYPNINFIQIKTDEKSKKRIKELDIKNQFYIDSDCKAHQFLTSKMPRCILVDKNGKVVNGYSSISSDNLNSYLEELNKK